MPTKVLRMFLNNGKWHRLLYIILGEIVSFILDIFSHLVWKDSKHFKWQVLGSNFLKKEATLLATSFLLLMDFS